MILQVGSANGFTLTYSLYFVTLPLFTHSFFPLYITFIFPLSSTLSSPTSLSSSNQTLKSSIPNINLVFMNSCVTTRPCYLEQDHGLASLANMDAGNNYRTYCTFVSRSMTMGYATSYNRSSFRNLSSVSSPRSARFYDSRFEDHHPHFLESCFLCKKPLGDNRDIFMYRGDTPFCSEECREEQIEIDEAKEKNKNLSSSMKAMRKKEQSKSSSPNKAQNNDYSFRTGAVAAAV